MSFVAISGDECVVMRIYAAARILAMPDLEKLCRELMIDSGASCWINSSAWLAAEAGMSGGGKAAGGKCETDEPCSNLKNSGV